PLAVGGAGAGRRGDHHHPARGASRAVGARAAEGRVRVVERRVEGESRDRRRLRRATRRHRPRFRNDRLRLLLDTHLVLWWMGGEPSKISERALAALGSEGQEPVVSAVTIWEAAIKRSMGKLKALDGMRDEIERAGVELLPVTARHADL